MTPKTVNCYKFIHLKELHLKKTLFIFAIVSYSVTVFPNTIIAGSQFPFVLGLIASLRSCILLLTDFPAKKHNPWGGSLPPPLFLLKKPLSGLSRSHSLSGFSSYSWFWIQKVVAFSLLLFSAKLSKPKGFGAFFFSRFKLSFGGLSGLSGLSR